MTAGYIGTRGLFWPERLAYILGDAVRERVRRELLDGVAPPLVAAVMAVVAAADGEVLDRLDALIETLKAVEEGERESLLEVLSGATGRNPAALEPRMLDWQQVRELAEAGVEIGSHGMSHAILTRVDVARAAEEIESSRRRLADELGSEPVSFAYPNGDWNPTVAALVREAGYQRAVVTDAGFGDARAAAEGAFAVPRKNLAEGSSRGARGFSESVFACEVLGVFDALRALGGRR
jgi:hypothetical protein